MPLSGKIAEAFTQYLCKDLFEGQKVRMRQDFSGIECLQENKKQESEVRKNEVQAITQQFKSGFITYNRGLEVLGEKTIDGMNLYYWQMDDDMRSKFDFTNIISSQQQPTN